MQVIRIEHKVSKWGIFTHRFRDIQFARLRMPELFERHCYQFPEPQNEANERFLKKGMNPKHLNLYKDNKTYYCAYKSVKQIQEWVMPEEFAIMVKGGFNIWLLEVTDFQEGNYQVLYTKESIVSKQIINDLFI